MPSEMVVTPVKVLTPESVQAPEPVFVIPPVPEIALLISPTPVLVASRVSKLPPLAIVLLKVVLPVPVTDQV